MSSLFYMRAVFATVRKVQLRLRRSAASTTLSAAFRASSKVVDVFILKTRIYEFLSFCLPS